MTPPRRDASPPGKSKLLLGLGLILAGILAWFIEYREGKVGTILLEVPLQVSEFVEGFETPEVVAPADRVFKIRVRAPVDNSWMGVRVTVVDQTGRAVDECGLKLEFYHGMHEGRSYQTGSTFDSGLLRVSAAGRYRFRISVTAGQGDTAVPQSLLAAKPLRLLILDRGGSAPQWRMVLSVAAPAAGLALVLPALADLRRRSREVGKVAKIPGTDLEPVLPAGSGDRMTFIDGLRGVACLSVVLCHFSVPGISQIAAVLQETFPKFIVSILRHGELGVEIFFVLSGLVIAYSLRNRPLGAKFVWRFAARRAIRLDPPYHLTLCVMAAQAAWLLPDTFCQLGPWFGGTPGVWANVFYLQDILRQPHILSIAWTLCLEIQFYLALVLLVWLAQALRRWLQRHQAWNPGPIAFILVFGPLAVLSIVAWFPSLSNFTFLGTWFRFFLGALTWWAMEGRIRKEVPGILILALLVLGSYTEDPRSIVAALTALLILVSHARGSLSRWLGAPLWQFLGRISYSLYLVHFMVAIPLTNWLWSLGPPSPAMAVTLLGAGTALSILTAWLFYCYIERPSIALSRTISY